MEETQVAHDVNEETGASWGKRCVDALKIILPLGFMLLGLAMIIYPRIAGEPLIPVYEFGDLENYRVWEIPLVYIWSYLTKAWGALILAFLMGGCISVFVPREKMVKYLSSEKTSSYFIAAGFAPLLTVCSCAMIPVFGGIMIAGAGIGPGITFLLMAPAANIMAIIFTVDIISWKVALARLAFSFIGAVIIGMIVARTPWARRVEEKYRSMGSGIAEVEGGEEVLSLSDKFWESTKAGWDLFKTVVPYLFAGVLAVSFIEAYVPQDMIATYFGGTLGIFIAALIGVPAYTPTLVEVFFVNSLINVGLAPAAGLAFMIGGPMASIPSMMGVSRLIGWKTVLTYAVLAVLVAFAAGLFYAAFITTL